MEFETGESRTGFRWGALPSASDGLRLVTGNAGDHRLIFPFLRAANLAGSHEDFVAWTEEPTYEPTDRLLVKHGNQIVAHALVVERLAWFAGVKLPVGAVHDLVTLPEYRELGCERLLLTAAEQRFRDGHAVVTFARTDRAELFQQHGWSEIAPPRCTTANVNEILARLAACEAAEPKTGKPFRIRLWRQVELDSLRAVYQSAAAGWWGAIDRSEPYWRWLVGRKVHDDLVVAIRGQDRWDDLHKPCRIVGYAAIRGPHVVELCTLSGYERAARPLLIRACQDAIENGQRSVSLQLPSSSPLHRLLLEADGDTSEVCRDWPNTFVRMLDPFRWIESHAAGLAARAAAGNIALPCRVHFQIGPRHYRLEVAEHTARLVRDTSVADVIATPEMFASLLLGAADFALAKQAGTVEFRSDEAAAILAALFPAADIWQSQFDYRQF